MSLNTAESFPEPYFGFGSIISSLHLLRTWQLSDDMKNLHSAFCMAGVGKCYYVSLRRMSR